MADDGRWALKIVEVRAIELLVAERSAEANQVLLDAFSSTSDRVLLALLEEALLESAPDVAPVVIEAYLASNDPVLLGRLSGLLVVIAGARPELESEVIGRFLGALEDPDRSPERAGAATSALASLGIAAADEIGEYLVDPDSGPKGVGSAAWLIAELPDAYGDVVREKLAEGLRGSLDALELGPSQEERDEVLQKTGSLAWSTSLRPEEEHDRLSEVLLETLLATRDPAQAGSLAWGLGNLKGLSDRSRIGTTRSLLDALHDQTDDSLRQQYLHTVHQLAVEQPLGPSFYEMLQLIQDARTAQGEHGELTARLDWLLAQLRAHEEKERR